MGREGAASAPPHGLGRAEAEALFLSKFGPGVAPRAGAAGGSERSVRAADAAEEAEWERQARLEDPDDEGMRREQEQLQLQLIAETERIREHQQASMKRILDIQVRLILRAHARRRLLHNKSQQASHSRYACGRPSWRAIGSAAAKDASRLARWSTCQGR